MSLAESPVMHLQRLILDSKVSATRDQKVVCLKTVRIAVKNLVDPLKIVVPKYFQLELSNEKVKAKIMPCPSALNYTKALGFVAFREDGGEHMRIESSFSISDMQTSLVDGRTATCD